MNVSLRAGWSRWQAVFGAALLPPLFAGPLRVIFRLPLSLANVTGLLFALWCAWILRPGLASPSLRPGARWMARLMPIAIAGMCCFLLYSRAFGGVTELVGADGGNHAAYLRRFRSDADAYLGFVSMYSAWDGIATVLRVDLFWAFVVVFYLVVCCVAVMSTVPALITLSRFDSEQPRAWWVGAATATLAALAAQLVVVLPLEHYFQSEGWWPQLYGLVPLMLLWVLDATVRVPWQRMLIWAVSVMAVRYTYGLNLPELLIAFALVVVVESRHRLRWAVAVVCVAGAGWTLYKLWPAFSQFGWFIPYPLPKLLIGEALAVAALSVAAFADRPATRGSGLIRALRVPLLFGGIGAVLTTGLWCAGPGQLYYLLKYPFQNVILLSLGLVAALAAMAAILVARWRRWTVRDLVSSGLVFGCAVGAGWLWSSSLEPYQAGFLERVRGKPPFIALRPLADLGAWTRIRRTLDERHAQFGGYLVSFGPMSNFMNGALGVADGQRFYFEGHAPLSGPGYCVFWDESKKALWSDWDARFPQRRFVKDLAERTGNTCVEYFSHWDSSERRRLCYRCD